VTLDLGVTQNRDYDGVRGTNADATAMIRLRQNLFRGGSDDARIRQAEARVDEANAGLARARNDVERELRVAHEAYRAERARLPALAEHARASEAVAEAYAAQFRLGQRSLFDLLNAEAERFSARGNLVTGQYSALAAGFRALAALGRLLDALGLTLLGNGPGASQ
jgi:adhesin transport system outer membrane protein